MKITDVKVHLIRTNRNTTIPSPWIQVQVFTDEGLVGLGDGSVHWFRNVGSAEEPEFASSEMLVEKSGFGFQFEAAVAALAA